MARNVLFSTPLQLSPPLPNNLKGMDGFPQFCRLSSWFAGMHPIYSGNTSILCAWSLLIPSTLALTLRYACTETPLSPGIKPFKVLSPVDMENHFIFCSPRGTLPPNFILFILECSPFQLTHF